MPITAFNWIEPATTPMPLVIDSPHSGMTWPEGWRPSAPRTAILTTWDAFVDELWSGGPQHGAALLSAVAPRAYVDVNRAESDIDPALLEGDWPTPLAPTDYSRRGMGLVRRLALPDVPMYDAPLSIAEVQGRIERYYRPYREALRSRLHALRAQHEVVLHLNAHSMKSRGNAMNLDAGAARPDVVLSDRHGSTAAPHVTAWAVEWFRARGLRTQMNTPYQGGDLVRTFGSPADGVHSVQVEFNRALYMDEAQVERASGFAALQATCSDFVAACAKQLTAGAWRVSST